MILYKRNREQKHFDTKFLNMHFEIIQLQLITIFFFNQLTRN
jgi:hypothetical protein